MNEKNNHPKQGVFTRFTNALAKTRTQLSTGIGSLLLGRNQLDQDILEELRTQLLIADVGVVASDRLIDNLSRGLRKKQLRDGKTALITLREDVRRTIEPLAKPFEISPARPFVIFVVGVNGVGKTTTIGKLSHLLQAQGYSVLLAAGDTYRAAAIEQLQVWGERTDVPVIAQQSGSDSASVIFDALQAAAARDIDIVIADTAGRLHNKQGLMDELSKIRRVIARYDVSAPQETLLVLDANIGQNAILQIREFKEAVGVSGLIVTKLDGSAKAGVIVGLAAEEPLPLYFVGLGEKQEDLQSFDANAFVAGLFAS